MSFFSVEVSGTSVRSVRTSSRIDFNFAHSKDYRNGDKGYRSSYGPKYDYIAGYRAGYEEGYATGYDQPGHGRGRAATYRRNGGYDNRDGYYDDQGRFHSYGTSSRLG